MYIGSVMMLYVKTDMLISLSIYPVWLVSLFSGAYIIILENSADPDTILLNLIRVYTVNIYVLNKGLEKINYNVVFSWW